ncbi:MAG: DUF4398 domain-containing protein [Polyangiaceae bacterium]|nr:DUF4398 domain-containing protein [Polyangiaceae bacterium]
MMTPSFFRSLAAGGVLLVTACAGNQSPASLKTADAVALSPFAKDAAQKAPQAFAEAQSLLKEAHQAQSEGRSEEAAVLGEEAQVAFEIAFALTRTARAQERLEKAEAEDAEAEAAMRDLDIAQAKLTREADGYELRARVILDTEEVKDIEKMTPERRRARRDAAQLLTAEAQTLCMGAALLNPEAEGLQKSREVVERLEVELSHGSTKDDLYPRAAHERNVCLKHLTLARRSEQQAQPDKPGSDSLLLALSKNGQWHPYRDDRGVVVTLHDDLLPQGKLSEGSRAALDELQKVAHAHPTFSLLLLIHGDGKNQLLNQAGKLALESFELPKEPESHLQVVGDRQPLVSRRIPGAATRNTRIEVIFVPKGT